MVLLKELLNPDYRLGNQLFAYNLLRQVAAAAEVAYVHPAFRERRWFSDMEEVVPQRETRTALSLTMTELMATAPGEILPRIRTLDAIGEDVELCQPILGETFFRYTLTDPSRFLRFCREFRYARYPDREAVTIGVHFRGRDFARWDPRAVLSFDYYRQALDLCMADSSEGAVELWLFTDDRTLRSLKELLTYVKNTYPAVRIQYGSKLAPPILDLERMSKCDYIISTPSTFSFWGGVLGKRKKIIHSKRWVDAKLTENDLFWSQMINPGSQFYHVLRLI